MNYKNLTYKLNKTLEMLDSVYDINYGGCCYVAYCIATLLWDSNIDYQLIVLEDDAEEEIDLNISHYHYGLTIEDKYFINISENDLEEFDYARIDNPDPEVIKEHYDNNEWNEMYNTDKNEFIKGIITTFYNEFINDN